MIQTILAKLRARRMMAAAKVHSGWAWFRNRPVWQQVTAWAVPLLAIIGFASALLVGSGGGGGTTIPTPSASSTPPPPRAATPPAASAAVNPLNGNTTIPAGKVLAVKVDNVGSAAQLQRGLDQA